MEIIFGIALLILFVASIVFSGLFSFGIFKIIYIVWTTVLAHFERAHSFPLTAKPRWFMWLYTILVAYLLFSVLWIDFAVAGASVRVNGDIINLRRMTNSLLGITVLLINLPLLPLLFASAPLSVNNRELANAQLVWKGVFYTFVLIFPLALISLSPSASIVLGKFFHLGWFWWQDLMLWLDADNPQTLTALAHPELKYDRVLVIDALILCCAYLPFAFFREQTLPALECPSKEASDNSTTKAPMPSGEHST